VPLQPVKKVEEALSFNQDVILACNYLAEIAVAFGEA